MQKESSESELSCHHLTALIEAQPPNPEALKRRIEDFDMLLDTQDTLRLNMESVRNFIQISATWILQNSASSALSTVVRLLHKLLILNNYTPDFKLGAVFSYEMERNKPGEPAKADIDDQESKALIEQTIEVKGPEGKNDLLSPTLASAVLSLLLSILSKEDPGKYKNFICILVELSSFFMQADRSYQRSYRKHKALKSLLLFMKVLLEKDDPGFAENGNLLTQLIHFYASASYGSAKNQDYLMSKGMHKWVLAFLSPAKFPLEFVKAAAMLLGVMPALPQHRALIMGDGGVTRLLQMLKLGLESANPTLLASTLFAIWSICQECDEAQEEVWSAEFPSLALQLLKEHPAELNILIFTLGVLRKVAKNQERRDELAKLFLRALLSFLKAFGEALGGLTTPAFRERLFSVAFLLKQIVALLGVLAADEPHRLEIVAEPGLLEQLLAISLRCLQFAKLLKTTVGLLINLSVSQQCLQILAQKPDFYALLYLSLKHYPRSQPMMDYVLKLALNLTNNTIALRNLGSGSFFSSSCQLMQIHRSSLTFLCSLFHILKTLCSQPQTTNKFAKNFVEAAAASFSGLKAFLNYLVDLLSSASDSSNLELFVAVTVLCANLCNSSPPFQEALIAQPKLFSLFETALTRHKADREAVQVLSEAIATLPVEGFET